jgi:hypothetical protein
MCPAKEPLWLPNIIVVDGKVHPNPDYQGSWPMSEEETKEEKLTRRQQRRLNRKRRKEREERLKKRQGKAAAKAERISARAKRQKKKADQRKALGREQELMTIPVNDDNLKTFDRNSHELKSHPLRNLWWPAPGAFLICGGPSVNENDLSLLDDPRIMSLGVNNVGGWIKGVKAVTFSDPTEKFSGHMLLNPGIMKLVPQPKLRNQIRLKHPETGEFVWGPVKLKDCPNTFGFARHSRFDPDDFLTDDAAQWGGEWRTHRKILYSAFLGYRLLHYLGIRNIFLLGVDHMMSDNSGYAFPQGRHGGAVKSNNRHYQIINEEMVALRPVLEAAGLHVYNCNKGSGCPAWDYVSYEDAIRVCTSMVPPHPLDLVGWYEKGGDKNREEDTQGE